MFFILSDQSINLFQNASLIVFLKDTRIMFKNSLTESSLMQTLSVPSVYHVENL